MSIKKCENHIILSIIVIGTLILGFGISLECEKGFYAVIPVDNAGLELIIIFILIVIAGIIGGLIIGYILGPLFLIVHRLIFKQKTLFGIQEKPEPEIFKGTIKAFFPALLAVHIALMFGGKMFMIEIIVTNPSGAFAPLLTVLILTIITFFISMALFSPIWFLLESGIVYSNKEKVKNKREPIELRSVGGWFMSQLKGYVGIAVIISYVVFTIEMIVWIGPALDISALIILVLFPFILTILGLPAMICLELTINNRRNYILKFAKKIGITKIIGDPVKDF